MNDYNSSIVKKYSCTQCGHPFDAYPPDDNFTFAMSKSCDVCDVLKIPDYVKRNYECDNCDTMNPMYWHVPRNHNDLQKRQTEITLTRRRISAYNQKEAKRILAENRELFEENPAKTKND